MQHRSSRNVTVNWFQMFHHVSVSNLHWSAQKRMQQLFRRGERRNSITIVVYSGSITRSMCIILHNQPHYESMTRARSNITACQLRRRQRSTLGRLRRHIFMTTVGLAVGYFRDTHTHTGTHVLVLNVSLSYTVSLERLRWHVGRTLARLSHVVEATLKALHSAFLSPTL